MPPDRKRRRLSNGTSDTNRAAVSEKSGQVEDVAVEGPPQLQAKSRSIFVRSLPATATSQSLIDYFSESYPIKHATAIIDPATKACKGYGFVTFTESDDAAKALDEFEGAVFEGRKIKVEAAEPRHRELEETSSGQRSRRGVPSSAALEAKAKREADKQRPNAQSKLIIRNLPWSIKEPEHLAALFKSYGKVKQSTLPKKGPGLLAGFGFVVIRGHKNAEKALEGVNGKKIDGRTVAVDWAVDKETWTNQHAETLEDEAADLQAPVEGVTEEGMSVSDSEPDETSINDNMESDISENDEGEEDDSEVDDELEDENNAEDRSSTIFIRNLPFTASDESLNAQFTQFGPVRYARVVIDPNTERPRGTGFVCFYNTADAISCLQNAPIANSASNDGKGRKLATNGATFSVLQNLDSDPSGRFTMEGRVLQISQAVNRSEAAKLTEAGVSHRLNRDGNRRRLFLLSEGTISSKSPLYEKLSPSEIAMREASAKQRKALVQSNPSLHLSLTRLSVRNIPRSVTSKDLKALAREAVVEFAKDVKSGVRQPMSKEELARGGEEMYFAERERKKKGVGIVKQAKIVFEGREGGKVSEDSGAGRSRGYGFIEYHSHRSALMGLRWLNGHAIKPGGKTTPGSKGLEIDKNERKKRLIVEFAIENAQVVKRRKERESSAREQLKTSKNENKAGQPLKQHAKSPKSMPGISGKTRQSVHQKEPSLTAKRKANNDEVADQRVERDKEKIANRSRIIERKRMKRRMSRRGKVSA